MADVLQVSLQGDRELIEKLEGLPPRLTKKLTTSAMRKAAKPILDEAKRIVPVRTGTLRKSIRIRALKRSRRRFGVQVITGEGFFKGKTFYGGMVEYGTSRQAAQPFMRPAAKRKVGEVRRVFNEELAKALNEIARETR